MMATVSIGALADSSFRAELFFKHARDAGKTGIVTVPICVGRGKADWKSKRPVIQSYRRPLAGALPGNRRGHRWARLGYRRNRLAPRGSISPMTSGCGDTTRDSRGTRSTVCAVGRQRGRGAVVARA